MAVEITRILQAAREGDQGAVDDLYRYAYQELRQVARNQLSRLRGGTLQTTEVVHEAYLRLFAGRELEVGDRAHFYAVSARAMRQVLIDRFRGSQAEKRGGRDGPLTLDESRVPLEQRGKALLDLDDALDRLAALDPRLSQVVELRFFGGMTQAEIGEALGVSERTVRNDWLKAKGWLARELAGP